MTAQQIQDQIGGTFEHTGGNTYCVTLGAYVIGPFQADGQPADEVDCFDTEIDQYVPLWVLGVR